MGQAQGFCKFQSSPHGEAKTNGLSGLTADRQSALVATIYRYYVLIAACVFARKTDWLRNACLAAVLLFPAVAALHGVVIAALNLHG